MELFTCAIADIMRIKFNYVSCLYVYGRLDSKQLSNIILNSLILYYVTVSTFASSTSLLLSMHRPFALLQAVDRSLRICTVDHLANRLEGYMSFIVLSPKYTT